MSWFKKALDFIEQNAVEPQYAAFVKNAIIDKVPKYEQHYDTLGLDTCKQIYVLEMLDKTTNTIVKLAFSTHMHKITNYAQDLIYQYTGDCYDMEKIEFVDYDQQLFTPLSLDNYSINVYIIEDFKEDTADWSLTNTNNSECLDEPNTNLTTILKSQGYAIPKRE